MAQSLNVAACAAIVLAETLRLRTMGGAEGGAGAQQAPRLSEEDQQVLEERFMPINQLPTNLLSKAKAKALTRKVGKTKMAVRARGMSTAAASSSSSTSPEA